MRVVAHHSANVPQQNNGQVSSFSQKQTHIPYTTTLHKSALKEPLPTLVCTTEASQLPYRPIRIHYTIELIPIIISELLRKQENYKNIKTMSNTILVVLVHKCSNQRKSSVKITYLTKIISQASLIESMLPMKMQTI